MAHAAHILANLPSLTRANLVESIQLCEQEGLDAEDLVALLATITPQASMETCEVAIQAMVQLLQQLQFAPASEEDAIAA